MPKAARNGKPPGYNIEEVGFMTSKADWPVMGSPVDHESNKPLFFEQHEWETIEAATARIIPTDHDPALGRLAWSASSTITFRALTTSMQLPTEADF